MKTPFEELVELIKKAEHEPRRYSGRGMCGEYCLGVTTDDPTRLIIDIMRNASDANKDDIADVLYNYRTDNMGRREIIYFPRCEWPEREEDEDS